MWTSSLHHDITNSIVWRVIWLWCHNEKKSTNSWNVRIFCEGQFCVRMPKSNIQISCLQCFYWHVNNSFIFLLCKVSQENLWEITGYWFASHMHCDTIGEEDFSNSNNCIIRLLSKFGCGHLTSVWMMESGLHKDKNSSKTLPSIIIVYQVIFMRVSFSLSMLPPQNH